MTAQHSQAFPAGLPCQPALPACPAGLPCQPSPASLPCQPALPACPPCTAMYSMHGTAAPLMPPHRHLSWHLCRYVLAACLPALSKEDENFYTMFDASNPNP